MFSGGLSGVAFGDGVTLISRVTQGCQPMAPERDVSAVDGNVLLALGGEPALDVMLRDLDLAPGASRAALQVVRRTLVGLSSPGEDGVRRTGDFGADVIVRHIIGVDPDRCGVAIADQPRMGQRIAFCQRHPQAARADLMRVCAEIRDELESEQVSAHALDTPDPDASELAARRIRGAFYISCAGRSGPHFGGPNAELQIVSHSLGDVPLTGFFAGGEIARHHLYGYTGVLTVFVDDVAT